MKLLSQIVYLSDFVESEIVREVHMLHQAEDITQKLIDVFVALSEDRPYRSGMHRNRVLEILKDKGERDGVDKKMVELHRKKL